MRSPSTCPTASRGAALRPAHCVREVRAMDPKIVGTVMPVLELNMYSTVKGLPPTSTLSPYTTLFRSQTSTTAGGQQGGFLGALGRAVAGGTLFMTEYTSVGG